MKSVICVRVSSKKQEQEQEGYPTSVQLKLLNDYALNRALLQQARGQALNVEFNLRTHYTR